MKQVYLGAKVQSRIKSLKKNGKAGDQLARKVTRIIAGLTSGTVQFHRDAIDSYTKYGEKRIKKCRKYELGCGYRLITVQRDSKTYIPFLGPHDECQRWLENHSRMKAPTAGKGTWFRFSKSCGDFENPAGRQPADSEDAHCDPLESEVNDKDLRRVFRGLVEGIRRE